MTLINAHILDERGVYVRTEQVDPMGPQPRGAIYDSEGDTLPEAEEGFTRMRQGGAWVQVPDAEVSTPPTPTQFELDKSRYKKRAAVKDELLAWMAADNMSRVRSGAWTVADLTGLLDDPAVVAANALMGTLSFELASAQIAAATTPLLTAEIKAEWIARLETHYYLGG